MTKDRPSLPSFFMGVNRRLISAGVGGVLVLAATLKLLHFQHDEGSALRFLPHGPAHAVGMLLIEFSLGLALVLGWFRQITYLLAISLFAVFLGASLAKGLNGDLSCGCLGNFNTSPWIIVTLDAFILGTMTYGLTRGESPRHFPLSSIRSLRSSLAPIICLIAIPFVGSHIFFRAIVIDSRSSVVGPTWVGHTFPSGNPLSDVTSSARTSTILIIHADCAKCQALMNSLCTDQPTSYPLKVFIVGAHPRMMRRSRSPMIDVIYSTDSSLPLPPTPILVKIENSIVTEVRVSATEEDLL